jgi:hypothetical protein
MDGSRRLTPTWLAGFAAGVVAFGGFANEWISFGLPIWLRDAAGLRTPVEWIGERLFRVLPATWFGLLVTTFERVGRDVLGVDHFGKMVGFVSANVVTGAIGAGTAHGLRGSLSRAGALAGLLRAAAATWAGWVLIWTPLSGAGFLAAETDRPIAYLGWLAVYSAAFVLLVRVLAGRLLSPAPGSSTEVIHER